MIRTVIHLLPAGRARDVAFTAGGAAALLAGQRLAGISMLGRAALGAERRWHDQHPEFDGTWAHRWSLAVEAYDRNHTTRGNRVLHALGLPLMAGGAAGLLLFRAPGPLWAGAVGAVAAGWSLGLAGHLLMEDDAPLGSRDVLAGLAGPLRDLRHLGALIRGEGVALTPSRPETITIYGGEPAQA